MMISSSDLFAGVYRVVVCCLKKNEQFTLLFFYAEIVESYFRCSRVKFLFNHYLIIKR
jgi:hypothetical protein